MLPPKWIGENNGSGKPYEQMDDLGGVKPNHPYFWVDTQMKSHWYFFTVPWRIQWD